MASLQALTRRSETDDRLQHQPILLKMQVNRADNKGEEGILMIRGSKCKLFNVPLRSAR